MALTIKKQDSVSSILMFVFNVFLVEQDITSIPLRKILQVFQPFKKSETSIRMGLSRAVQYGILRNVRIENEVYYQLTDEGTAALVEWQETMTSFQRNIALQLGGWNGFWSLVVIDEGLSGGSSNSESLVALLDSLKYGRPGRNLWISPYDRSQVLLNHLNDNANKIPKVLVFQAQAIAGISNQELAQRAWDIQTLSQKYKQFVDELRRDTAGLQKHLTGEMILPFLHIHGLKLFDIMRQDPQLPLEVLPEDWLGLKAAQEFMTVRETVLPVARKYLDSILAEQ